MYWKPKNKETSGKQKLWNKKATNPKENQCLGVKKQRNLMKTKKQQKQTKQ